MNPWISEQLAAEHRADLHRMAAGRTYLRTQGDRRDVGGAGRARRWQGVRGRTGEMLIRAGARLAGPQSLPLHPWPPAAG